ncbi:hypothetical protein ACFV19_20965 [Streptomyces griseoluteus]|uniref:hypothetical protein n=1 Tax=Streptomyces griseoluteus TaxID=29306 RepID=UPI0036C00949
MGISKTLLGIAMIAVATAGCGGPGSHDSDSLSGGTRPPRSGKELPVAINSPVPGLLTVKSLLAGLPPKPPRDAPFTEQLLWMLRKDTVAMAGVPGKTSAACEGKVSELPGVRTRCTVIYNGVKVSWFIRFQEPAGDLKPYEIVNAGQTVLRAKAVYGEFFRAYNRVSKHLRCGKVPDLELVVYGQDTGYRCQYASFVNGKARWINVPVSVGERGVVFNHGRSPKSP